MSKEMMGVDWEERIDFDRMRRDRLQKAKKVLAESEADVLFVFRTEDARYLTGFRTHMHPSTQLLSALPRPKRLSL
jgi:Xaa-Pro aminopeptidase